MGWGSKWFSWLLLGVSFGGMVLFPHSMGGSRAAQWPLVAITDILPWGEKPHKRSFGAVFCLVKLGAESKGTEERHPCIGVALHRVGAMVLGLLGTTPTLSSFTWDPIHAPHLQPYLSSGFSTQGCLEVWVMVYTLSPVPLHGLCCRWPPLVPSPGGTPELHQSPG